MRLSEISSKEIIDYQKGERLGILGQTDLLVNEETGEIEAFIIPTMKWFGFGKKDREVTVYWNQVKKIGEDMIIINLDQYE
ncbi:MULTISPECIES: YlmC/YmxH family sporulation protein [Halalkalibacter]|jgi:YlmC/YmxH family sporulation protein|uniref:YlmC/YmxH family sporulation protein n=1 Tax=Halalkalibacter alkaliphilus TaxID=2917993 RepID=A0A9X2CQZ7_9BACI|nr:YlmC/YmxH family sporulation protein [Halalkalibacter alkaliphilus]MCL7746516.1 YlmC/YmxH family sporulation protein [Halalkalibacter alkaliphilus]